VPEKLQDRIDGALQFQMFVLRHRRKAAPQGRYGLGFLPKTPERAAPGRGRGNRRFYLGESLLLDWLPDAVKAAKDEGFPYVFITTNGSLAKPDKVRACMEAGLDSMKFSLNYADEEQFTQIARVRGAYWGDIIIK